MANHILKKIDTDTAAIKTRIAGMAAVVDGQLDHVITILEKRHLEHGLVVDKLIVQINDAQLAIDRECANFIVMHQPNASDLRTVLAAMRIGAELQRLGTKICGVARGGELVYKQRISTPLPAMADIVAFARLLQQQLADGLADFTGRPQQDSVTKTDSLTGQPLLKHVMKTVQDDQITFAIQIEMVGMVKDLLEIELLIHKMTQHLHYQRTGEYSRH